MNVINLSVGIDDEGRRLDRVLKKILPNHPLSFIYKSLRKKLITVNNKKATPEYLIKKNDILNIADFITTHLESATKTAPIPKIETIFCNEDFQVINKKVGILTHGGGSTKKQKNIPFNSLDDIVKAVYQRKNSLSFTPGPLHRLDKYTSGIIVFSQSLKGARQFSLALQQKKLTKTYLAIIEGHIDKKTQWTHHIDKKKQLHTNGKFITVKVYSQPQEAGKFAQSVVMPLAQGMLENKKPFSFVAITIETGRSHQIRAQASFQGHPLLGDTAYGGTKLEDSAISSPFFLHAFSLAHQNTEMINFPEYIQAPIPSDYQFFLKKHLKPFDILPYTVSNENHT